MLPFLVLRPGLVVLATMVDLEDTISLNPSYNTKRENRAENRSTDPYDPLEDLGSVHVVHGEHGAPLVFVHDEPEALRLARRLVSREVDVGYFAPPGEGLALQARWRETGRARRVDCKKGRKKRERRRGKEEEGKQTEEKHAKRISTHWEKTVITSPSVKSYGKPPTKTYAESTSLSFPSGAWEKEAGLTLILIMPRSFGGQAELQLALVNPVDLLDRAKEVDSELYHKGFRR